MSGWPIAIDPMGCGCTECLTGEYVPLEDATAEHMEAAFRGELKLNTNILFSVTIRIAWHGLEDIEVYAEGHSWELDEIEFPLPVENFSVEIIGGEHVNAALSGVRFEK